MADLTSIMQMFHEELDTKFKAMLYLIMVGDNTTDDVQKLRRTTSAFFNQSAYVLKDTQMDVNTLKQKQPFTEQYNLHLHRENTELRAQIKNLKQSLAEQSLKDVDLTALSADDMDQTEKQKKDHLLATNKSSVCADKEEEN